MHSSVSGLQVYYTSQSLNFYYLLFIICLHISVNKISIDAWMHACMDVWIGKEKARERVWDREKKTHQGRSNGNCMLEWKIQVYYQHLSVYTIHYLIRSALLKWVFRFSPFVFLLLFCMVFFCCALCSFLLFTSHSVFGLSFRANILGYAHQLFCGIW